MKIYIPSPIRWNSYWNKNHVVLIYLHYKEGPFHCDYYYYALFSECLKSLRLSKMFYLQTAILSLCFHERMRLSWFLNMTCFMDLLLDSYKHDKTKVNIIISNSQIVNKIFKIQQNWRTVRAFRLDIKWKHLESKNAKIRNNFWMISILFEFMNLQIEFHKIFRNENKQKIKAKQFWHYVL